MDRGHKKEYFNVMYTSKKIGMQTETLYCRNIEN